MRLRIRWQENIVNFENTKKQLDELQVNFLIPDQESISFLEKCYLACLPSMKDLL